MNKLLILLLSFNLQAQSFKRPMVAFNFDDCSKSVYDIAYPIFKERNIQAIAYIVITWIGGIETMSDGNIDSCMSWKQIKSLHKWDVGSHDWDHVRWANINGSEMHKRILLIDSAFNANGLSFPHHWAYPYGSYSEESQDTISNYFLTARTSVANPIIKNNTDPYVLDRFSLNNNNMDKAKSLIDYVGKNNYALILLLHIINDTISRDNYLSRANLIEIIDFIQERNIKIVTMDELYSNLK